MDEAPSVLPPHSLPPSPSISHTPSFPPPLSHTLWVSPHSLFWFISLRHLVLLPFPLFFFLHPSLHPHVFSFLLPLHLSLFLLYLPCRCLVSSVPFKSRQMERQALSPSSGPNDLFLTMGPNGPQIINDEGSMERWAAERIREGEVGVGGELLSFTLSASLFFALAHQLTWCEFSPLN